MMHASYLMGMSLVAILIDRYALDRCLGKVNIYPNVNELVKDAARGIAVMVVLVLATGGAWLIADSVLFGAGLEYLYPLCMISIVVAISFSGELLFALWNPQKPFHRLFARTSVLCSLLYFTQFMVGAGTPGSLKTTLVQAATTGIIFTGMLVLFNGIRNRAIPEKNLSTLARLTREILIAGLLLLAFSGVETIPFFRQ
jgi:Na+-translocating ferredoxin:NAD+ oxidoreductase RnfA subunit